MSAKSDVEVESTKALYRIQRAQQLSDPAVLHRDQLPGIPNRRAPPLRRVSYQSAIT
jgi:hypothetical protein